MASVTLPVTSVIKAGAKSVPGKFGATVVQGQFVYADPSAQNKFKLGIATSPVSANVVGMARNAGGDGQPADIGTAGEIESASGLTVGLVYCLSDTVAGGIMPSADLITAPTGTYTTVIGVATATTKLKLGILASGVQAD